MNCHHSYWSKHAPIPARTFQNSMASLRDAVRTSLAGLRSSRHERKMAPYVARYPEHLMRDIGFERDWDQSIIPLVGLRAKRRLDPDAA